MALTSGEAADMASDLVVAFSGVTLALIAASLAFLILHVRCRWLLKELRQIETSRGSAAWCFWQTMKTIRPFRL